ncbi:hypothetical protein AAG747_16475 [Rapidithrix thailandica]|uniref:Uncharacterized protein n=1 Tax=Rapidithrix thailandica TaxID=413964 RepID=A0AAW9S2S6_9BACT
MKYFICYLFFSVSVIFSNVLFAQNQIVEGYEEGGERSFVAHYKDGYLDGHYVEFYKKKKNFEGYFKQGKQDGLWVFYHTNGKVLMEANYKDGKLDGVSKEFSKKGNLIVEISYRDHLRHGTCKYYTDKKRSPWCIINYENGLLSGEAISMSSHLTFITTYSEDKKNGVSGFIDPEGTFKKVTEYKDGKAIDNYKIYKSLNLIEEYVLNQNTGKYETKRVYKEGQVVEEIQLVDLDTSFMNKARFPEKQPDRNLKVYLENNLLNFLAPVKR